MRPTRLCLAIGAVLLAMAIGQLFFAILEPLWFIPPLGLASIALIDALLLFSMRRPQADRLMSEQLTQGKTTTIQLRFSAGLSGAALRDPLLIIFDGIPQSFSAQNMPLRYRLDLAKRRHGFTISYTTTPNQRGRHLIEATWAEQSSILGFWWRRYRVAQAQWVRVYPDHRSLIDAFHIGGVTNFTSGNHSRRRGLGLEFHQLREYRQGDMMRMVDPKASSRVRKLIVREMQEEEDQSVLFLLDTGYRMMASEGGKTHFDQAFEAMLSLTWVALKQGDRVSIRTFGPVDRWLPPRRAVTAFPGLVQGLYDVFPMPEASSPAGILAEVLPRLNRRTLIILLSNFREEDNEDIQRFIPMIQSRHLLCTVWLRENIVEQLVQGPVTSHREALETAMAQRYMAERRRCRALWEDAGILTIDTLPSNLRGSLVQEYWNIKSQGRL